MRAAKERKRIASPTPDYPPERPDLCRRIIVDVYDCGEPVRTVYLLQVNRSRSDSYWLWRGKDRIGAMGFSSALRRIASEWPRIMRSE